MQNRKQYKAILYIVLLFILSYLISYACSLVLTKVTFEINPNQQVQMNSGDYVLFIKGDELKVSNHAKHLTDFSLMKSNDTTINLHISKDHRLKFPVEVGIEHNEVAGLLHIDEADEYRLVDELSSDDYKYALANANRFRMTLGITLTIGIIASLILFALFLLNLFRIPFIRNICHRLP